MVLISVCCQFKISDYSIGRFVPRVACIVANFFVDLWIGIYNLVHYLATNINPVHIFSIFLSFLKLSDNNLGEFVQRYWFTVKAVILVLANGTTDV